MKLITAVKIARHAFRLIRDPNRLDDAIAVADLVAQTPEAMLDIAAVMRTTPHGERALAERSRVGTLDLAALARLPHDTLGYAFASHVKQAGIDVAALPNRPASNDASYVEAHLYETHDIWHVVTGFGTDVAGELGLLAFYLAQFPGRLSLVLLGSAMFQIWLRDIDQRDVRMAAIVRGWLLGRRARALLGVPWNTLWTRPLSEVRAQLGIATAWIDGIMTEAQTPTAPPTPLPPIQVWDVAVNE